MSEQRPAWTLNFVSDRDLVARQAAGEPALTGKDTTAKAAIVCEKDDRTVVIADP